MTILHILLVSVVLRIVSLDQSFWLDEASQAVTSMAPLNIQHFYGDFQPPFSYFLTHLWMKFGIHDECFLRILPVIFGVLTVYIIYLIFKKVFDVKTAVWGSLLLATAPYHIYYSQEFRMYSLLVFLVALSWLFLIERKWVFYLITITLAVYSHYFAFLAILSHVLYVAVFKRKMFKKFMICLGLCVGIFTLWVPVLFRQIETARKLVELWPRWKEVSNPGFLKFPGLVLAKFTVGMISPSNRFLYGGVVLITGIIFALSLAVLFKNRSKKSWLIVYAFFVPLIATWISGLWIDASSPWRVQFVLPFFYAIITVGCLSIHHKIIHFHIGKIFLLIILLLNILFSSMYLLLPMYHRENWRDAVAYTDLYAQNGAFILSEFNSPFVPMQWYSHYPDQYIGASQSQKVDPESINAALKGRLSHTNHIILYTYLYEISDSEKNVEQYLEKNGYFLVNEKDFRGVGIIQEYQKNE